LNAILLIIITLLLAGFLFDLYLDHLNAKGWEKPLPEELADLYTTEQYQKAKDYHIAREKLGHISGTLSLVATLLMLLLGGFSWLNDIVITVSFQCHRAEPAVLWHSLLCIRYPVNSIFVIRHLPDRGEIRISTK
jgi:hypothetical protein